MSSLRSVCRYLPTLVVWCFALAWARADLTLVQRETCQGVGTLTAASPGNLGIVSAGSFFKRAVGPRLSGDTSAAGLGWSADVQITPNLDVIRQHTMQIVATPAVDRGMWSAWHYFKAVANNANNKSILELTRQASGNPVVLITVDAVTGHFLTLLGTNNITVDSGVAYPVCQWFELRHAWSRVAGNQYQYLVVMRLAGASAWTTILSGTYTFPSGIDNVLGGEPNGTNAAGYYSGRYGMPSLYAAGSFSDATAPIADVVDPTNAGITWYVDPVNGNDSNDGVTAASAWQGVSKINLESLHTGIFPHTSGYANGDTLRIDTTAANLILGTASLTVSTRALNVVQIGGGSAGAGEIQAWQQIPATQWSGPISGTSNVYQTTLTETNVSCVLWEDDKWLNHSTGASLATVLPALGTNSGSFWTDGTKMYVHPFGETNPMTDGKTYTRSYHRGAPFGAAAVVISAADVRLSGLQVRKTCLADKSTNDPVSAYCIQTAGDAGGTSLLENCVCRYGSKHIYGFTDTNLSRRYTINDCVAEQGSPYVAAGGQTAWVDYSQAPGTGTSTSTYNRCITIKNSGLIGSSDGTIGTDQPAWLSHNNNSTNYQFATVTFNDCQLAGGLGTYGATSQVVVTGGSCTSAAMNNSNGLFTRVLFTAGIPTSVGVNGVVKVRNCIMVLPRINGGGEPQAQGTIDVQNCTFDLRSTQSNTNSLGLYSRIGTLVMTWRDNLVLGSTSLNFGVIKNALISDTLVFDHNAYQNLLTPWIKFYDGSTNADRSLAQCQAIGKEAGSMTLTDVRVSDTLCPLADSPLIDLGIDTQLPTDYSGAACTARNDPGAWEYPLPALRSQPLGTELTEGGVLNLSAGVVGNGPLSYQWFKDGIAIPGATTAILHAENLLPGQSGQYLVKVSNTAGSVSTAPAAVLVHPLGLAQWQATRFTTAQLLLPNISGWTAGSPDGSGLTNLEEYMFGVLPQSSGNSVDSVEPATGLAADQVDGSGHLAIRYRRLLNAVGVSCAVEVSDDLLSWDASQNQVETLGAPSANSDGRTETVTVRLKLSTDALAGSSKFLRVRVSIATPQGGSGSSVSSGAARISRPTTSGPSNRRSH